MISKKKLISQLKLPINECINIPGRWVINNAFYLIHDQLALKKTGLNDVGRIYL